jgi:hypothetical protein
MLCPAPYLSQKLTQPVHTKDGVTLRTIRDARGCDGGIRQELAADESRLQRRALCESVWNPTNSVRVDESARNRRRRSGERPMLHFVARADRIDYWIRRHVISCPPQSRMNPARGRYVGLTAIGQCLKDQYDAVASPTPPYLAVLVEQLKTQK